MHICVFTMLDVFHVLGQIDDYGQIVAETVYLLGLSYCSISLTRFARVATVFLNFYVCQAPSKLKIN